jgi:hypothetical protein
MYIHLEIMVVNSLRACPITRRESGGQRYPIVRSGDDPLGGAGKRYAVRRIYAFGWQGGSATTVNMKVRSWGQYRWSAVESYPWSPSHDQCGMLRPFGTSSADWW